MYKKIFKKIPAQESNEEKKDANEKMNVPCSGSQQQGSRRTHEEIGRGHIVATLGGQHLARWMTDVCLFAIVYNIVASTNQSFACHNKFLSLFL